MFILAFLILLLFRCVNAIETDEWGYSWEYLSEFIWYEIRITGTSLPLSADDEFFAIYYPNFPFYEEIYDTLYITSNGLISFERGTRAYRNQALPADTVPPFIAPFWDDLSPQNGGAIFYYIEPLESSLVVEWYNSPHYSMGGPYTFQAILKKNGDIIFSYLNLNDPLNSATIGLQCHEHTFQILFNGEPPGNLPYDSLTLYIRNLEREIKLDSIISPPTVVFPTEIYIPTIKASNLGDIDTSVLFTIRILTEHGESVYSDSIVANIPAHTSQTINFTTPFSPRLPDSIFNVVAWSLLPLDEIPSDDTLKTTIASISRGYFVLNSRDNSDIVNFNWNEIASIGNNTGLEGDDATLQIDMRPFVFPFVDSIFTSLYVSTNGFISFSDNRSDYNNQDFPCDIRNILAPFWDDLILNNPNSAIYTMHDTTNNSFIVEWSDLSHYGQAASYTFQLILYSTGAFKYQYLRMNGTLTQASIGYQYGLGEFLYDRFLYNGIPSSHLPSDSFAILYLPFQPFRRRDVALLRVLNNLSYVTVGSTCTLRVEAKNNGTEPVSFTVVGNIFRGESTFTSLHGDVANLTPFTTTEIPLLPPIRIPDEPDTFWGIFYVITDEDMNPGNDTIQVGFRSSRTVLIEVVGNTALTALGGRTGSHYFAQGFIANGDTLYDAGMSIYGAESPYPDVRLEIWGANSYGYPNPAQVIYIGRTLDGRREIFETPRRYSIGLSEPIPVSRGNLYYIVINGTITPSYSGYCGVTVDLTNPYPYGTGYWSNDNGITWTNSPFEELDMDFYVILSTVTSVEEKTQDNKFEAFIYPNPANENFTIYISTSSKVEIDLYNIVGERVWHKSIQAGTLRVKPDINLRSGLYFIKIGDKIKDKLIIIR